MSLIQTMMNESHQDPKIGHETEIPFPVYFKEQYRMCVRDPPVEILDHDELPVLTSR